jgi:transposase
VGGASALRAAAQPAARLRITRLLDTHPYSAQQIFQCLRQEGYGGGVTILRDYARRIRPTRRPVYLKLHFAPGECAQVDWGAYGTVAVGNTHRLPPAPASVAYAPTGSSLQQAFGSWLQ